MYPYYHPKIQELKMEKPAALVTPIRATSIATSSTAQTAKLGGFSFSPAFESVSWKTKVIEYYHRKLVEAHAKTNKGEKDVKPVTIPLSKDSYGRSFLLRVLLLSRSYLF
jgi:hypothetical protein